MKRTFHYDAATDSIVEDTPAQLPGQSEPKPQEVAPNKAALDWMQSVYTPAPKQQDKPQTYYPGYL